jgi:hypothetical protein
MHQPLNGRRALTAGVAAVVAVALATPAAHADPSPIAVDAAQDSVLVTGLPFGQQTLQVTRPDLTTGKPVVIGQYQGLSIPGLPFGANTTAPSLFNPGGDCWQQGALKLAGGLGVTPDILRGDTVSVVGGPSLKVPADAPLSNGAPGGPIAGCDTLSVWGHNAVDSADFAAPGGDLSVSGHAQPGATGVAVTAADSAGVPADPVKATLAADGSYTATIPAASLAKLADGTLTVGADNTVPDVATGTSADIGGQTLSVDKKTPARPAAPAPAAPAPAAPAPSVALHGLFLRSSISAKSVKAGKLRVSFVAPTGAKFVRVRLSRPGHTAALDIVPAAAAGTRQTVAVTGAKLSKLVKGTYTVTVRASAVRTMFVGTELTGKVRVK